MAVTIPYRPISRDITPSYLGTEYSVPSALGRRLVDNGQFLLKERLPKTAIAYDAGPTNAALSGNPDATDLTGYRGDVAGTASFDTETIGLQFSTHPGNPLVLPIPFERTGWGNKIRVFLSLVCTDTLNIAAAYTRNGITQPTVLPNVNRSTYLGSGFYNSTELGEATVTIADTATTGTSGVSYVVLDINIPSLADGRTAEDQRSTFDSEAGTKDGFVLLYFASEVDLPSSDLDSINTIKNNGYTIVMDSDFSKFAPASNPGKLHKLIRCDIKNDPNATVTYHHVIQYVPLDPDDPYGVGSLGVFHIHPPILRQYLDNGNVEDGDDIRVYDITKVTLLGVSVQELYL